MPAHLSESDCVHGCDWRAGPAGGHQCGVCGAPTHISLPPRPAIRTDAELWADHNAAMFGQICDDHQTKMELRGVAMWARNLLFELHDRDYWPNEATFLLDELKKSGMDLERLKERLP